MKYNKGPYKHLAQVTIFYLYCITLHCGEIQAKIRQLFVYCMTCLASHRSQAQLSLMFGVLEMSKSTPHLKKKNKQTKKGMKSFLLLGLNTVTEFC